MPARRPFHQHQICWKTTPSFFAGLLAPRDRPKALTALAGAEPPVQAQTAPVQQLQFFLSELPGCSNCSARIRRSG